VQVPSAGPLLISAMVRPLADVSLPTIKVSFCSGVLNLNLYVPSSSGLTLKVSAPDLTEETYQKSECARHFCSARPGCFPDELSEVVSVARLKSRIFGQPSRSANHSKVSNSASRVYFG